MTLAAFEIHGARSVAARGIRVGHELCIGVGISAVRVLVMTEVAGTRLFLMLAIRSRRCPAELERHQDDKDEGEEAAHG